ncbi:MAG: JAB domain-containing protein [Flavisolibacter sp.]
MENMLSLDLLNNVSEIDLIYKRKVQVRVSQRPLIGTSYEAYVLLLHYWNDNKIELVEEFKVLLLNRSSRVLQQYLVSSGGITGTVADPRLILIAALKVGACSIILAHNHPSGNLQPSKADEELTQKIKNGAAFLDIKVLDHLILSAEGYYSFADNGVL